MAPPLWLFSYGTLRQPEVQRAVFGRELDSVPDALPGFVIDSVRITDPAVIAASGSDRHPILRRADAAAPPIPGAALAIREADLAPADRYEAEDYERIVVTLASGREAFVYVGCR